MLLSALLCFCQPCQPGQIYAVSCSVLRFSFSDMISICQLCQLLSAAVSGIISYAYKVDCNWTSAMCQPESAVVSSNSIIVS